MFKGFLKLVSIVLTLSVFTLNQSLSEIVNKIVVTGNERISEKTIKLFSEVSLNEELRYVLSLIFQSFLLITM